MNLEIVNRHGNSTVLNVVNKKSAVRISQPEVQGLKSSTINYTPPEGNNSVLHKSKIEVEPYDISEQDHSFVPSDEGKS